MRHISTILFFFSLVVTIHAQFVTLNPTGAGSDDTAVLIFDAEQGNKELMGATKVCLLYTSRCV